jgi:diaminopimelate decarboxylase
VSTGIRHSKFGIREDRVPWFLDRIRAASALRLVGVHCHLGSTINDISVFGEAARRMMKYAGLLRREGFEPRFINIGGGLGIAYDRGTTAPGPKELWEALSDCVAENITLIIEPGRSIVADAGVLVARVIGVKTNDDKRFVVVDASMTELIRPSLYGAYHHIDFIEPVGGEAKLFDIVGPVCESADFLGKDRQLATPHEGAGGFAMSSNYNARLRPPEYLVDGDRLTEIRRAETFEDHMRFFDSHQPAKGS